MRHSKIIVNRAKQLRKKGMTYGEINKSLNSTISKSTLAEWCHNVPLPSNYQERIAKLSYQNLGKARSIAIEINKIKREELFDKIKKRNLHISRRITEKDIAKIALSMLCLGEASKYGTKSAFSLGNSNPKIVILFIEMLKYCFDFDVNKIRCTVQCRADQDTKALESYWQEITGIPPKYFYKTRIDPRTIGKPTNKSNYKGVLKIDYLNKKIQIELESLSSLIYNIVTTWAHGAIG